MKVTESEIYNKASDNKKIAEARLWELNQDLKLIEKIIFKWLKKRNPIYSDTIIKNHIANAEKEAESFIKKRSKTRLNDKKEELDARVTIERINALEHRVNYIEEGLQK